ncbi:hypothetical protein B566_EDAN015618 [Ephemera danica]|nr:hypothetical protein B566_EDAN015618 [Ephemera danica]
MLQFFNTAVWLDNSILAAHQQDFLLLQRGFLEFFRDTTPEKRSDALIYSLGKEERPFIQRFLEALDAAVIQFSHGEDHIEEDLYNSLQAVRTEHFVQYTRLQDVDKLVNNRSDEEQLQHFKLLARRQIQEDSDNVRAWLLDDVSAEDIIDPEETNLDVGETLDWEVAAPAPVLTMETFNRLENDVYNVQYDPSSEEIADMEDEARAEGGGDADAVAADPQIVQPQAEIDAPPLQVNVDDAVPIPFVIPRNVLNYREVEPINVGAPTRRCSACSALLFPGELQRRATTSDMCCKNGQVHLPHPGRFPRYLAELLSGEHVDSAEFLKNICRYNQVLSLAVTRTTLPLRREHLNPFIVMAGGTAYCRVPLPQGHDPNDPTIAERSVLFWDSLFNQKLERGVQLHKLNPRIVGALAAEIAQINPLHRSFMRLGVMLAEERRQARLLGRPQQIVYIKEIDPPAGLSPLERRRYDPEQDQHEVAILVPGAEFPSNLIVYAKHLNQGQVPISSVHPHLDGMLYPVIHPYYEPGFRPNIPRIQVAGRGGNRRRGNVTRREASAFQSFERHGHANHFFHSMMMFPTVGVLRFQHIEMDRVRYISTHQNTMMCASRAGLEDYLERLAEQQEAEVSHGRIVRLPQSFQGGTANMTKRFLDAMALVRRYGHPDYFVTVTCNPNWSEIQSCLRGTAAGDDRPREYYYHRPDINNRVFRLKFREVYDLILQGKVFGPVICIVASIEFQKRGGAHAHMMLFGRSDNRVKTPEHVDAYVRATIPDETEDPELHALVKAHMLHNNCGPNVHGAKCMKDGKCSKNYPRAFRNETVLNDGNGRVAFRRPNDGRSIIHNGTLRTNQHIVSYNPLLLRLLQCHVNVDVIPSYRSMKYIFKYIYKGQDAMRVETVCMDEPERPIVILPQEGEANAAPGNDIAAEAESHIAIDPYAHAEIPPLIIRDDEPLMNDDEEGPPPDAPAATNQHAPPADPPPAQQRIWHDEATAYFNARYIGSMEAYWRILAHPMSYCTHAVIQLAIHEEGEATVFYHQNNPEGALRNPRRSTLEAFMALNASADRAHASQFHYETIPEHYRFDKGTSTWIRRGRNDAVIGRLIRINENTHHLYHIYLLLLHQRGFRSFEELRTVNNIVHPTYLAACEALGLLRNDDEHARAIRQASETGFGSQTRRLFAHLVVHCGVNNPAALFDEVLLALANNYIHAHLPHHRQRTLRQVAYYLRRLNFVAHDWPEMENLLNHDLDPIDAQECRDEEEAELQNRNVDIADLSASLNREQRSFFNLIIDKVFNIMAADTTLDDDHLFYLCGVGGCGKTFFYRALCQHLRRNAKQFKCASWTGISALLLPEGSTCHYTFGLPIKITSTSTSTLELHSNKATVLREAHVLIIDEISMFQKEALRIVDEILRVVMNNNKPFGGKLLIVGGDFQQLLPVINNVSANATALYSPCYSPLWPLFKMHRLVHNRRAAIDPAYAAYIAEIGRGAHPRLDGYSPQAVRFEQQLLVAKEDIVRAVFGDDVLATADDRAILTVRNAEAIRLNDEIVETLPGDLEELLSVDEPKGLPDVDLGQFPLQTLHAITPSGMSQHRLLLKNGVVVMLLRNMDISAGLVNGSRMRVRRILPAVLECELISGERRGSTVFIPRLNMECETSESPCPFSRYQFPVRVGFAMTINKSQGQTLSKVGLFLPRATFSHGQLYTGLSRVASYDDLFVCIPPKENQQGRRTAQQRRDEVSMTLNIVKPELIAMATSLDRVDLQRLMGAAAAVQ